MSQLVTEWTQVVEVVFECNAIVFTWTPNRQTVKLCGDAWAKTGDFNCQEIANVFWASAADLAVKRVCEKIRSRKERAAREHSGALQRLAFVVCGLTQL